MNAAIATLICSYQAGDLKAGGDLVEALSGLATGMARKYTTDSLEFEDALSVAQTAILEAAASYDPSRGATLATYATFYIRGRLQEAVNGGRTIRINASAKKDVLKVLRAHATLIDPTPDEIAAMTGIPIKRVTYLLQSLQYPARLDAPRPCGQAQHTAIPDTRESELERREREEHTNTQAAAALALLPISMQRIIRLRFGIGCEKKHTQMEVGEILGMSYQRVQQYEAKAIKIMREGMSR